MKNDLVSVIVVNFNGKKYLKDCLGSIIVNSYSKFEVILVDNNSHDESVEYVKKAFPQVKIIVLEKNFGFTGGNIEGVKNSNGEYLLFLNNDTKSDKNLILDLVEFYKSKKDCGILQPKIRILQNSKYLDGVGSNLTRTGFLQHVGHKELDRDINIIHPIKVFSVKGACMLMSRNIYFKAGGFDNRYFAYFEETDLCWRVLLLGKNNYYYPDALVYHAVGRTTSQLPLPFIEFHAFKNRIATLIKNLEVKNLIFILPLHILICVGISFIYLISGKWKNSRAIISAIKWNINRISYIRDSRKIIQKNRKISDDYIFKAYLKPLDFQSMYSTFMTYFIKRGRTT